MARKKRSGRTFGQNIALWAQATGEAIDTVMQESVLEIATFIVIHTPYGDPNLWVHNAGTKENPRYVDYVAARGWPDGYVPGKAIANWTASIGTPSTMELDIRDDDDGTLTIEKIQDVLSAFVDDVFYLTNNVKYIRRLEYEGWSTQAPSGMVRLSVSKYQTALDRAVSKLNAKRGNVNG